MKLMTGYDVVVCTDCGFMFANNIPSQEAFDAYYEEYNKYEFDAPVNVGDCEWENMLSSYLQEHYGRDSVIADVGCGTGKILRRLLDNGYSRLYGLDTSKANCLTLESKGIKTVCKSLFSIIDGDFDKKADVAISLGVLEHIVDLKRFVGLMVSLLKPEGDIIVLVPDIENPNGVRYPFQEFSTEHINYFTYESLCKLFAGFGFRPVNKFFSEGCAIVAFTGKSGAELLQAYCRQSLASISAALEKCDGLIQSQKPIVVYGVGTLTRYLLANTRFANLNITAFADGNKHYQGESLAGNINRCLA
jgi:SAM-dependent methyltransferase